jgi:hypothetical protein
MDVEELRRQTSLEAVLHEGERASAAAKSSGIRL